MSANKPDSIVIRKPGKYVKLMAGCCSAFIFLITVVYPLFAPTGHKDIGRLKWNFYSISVIAFTAIMVALGLTRAVSDYISEIRRLKKEQQEEDALFLNMAAKRAREEFEKNNTETLIYKKKQNSGKSGADAQNGGEPDTGEPIDYQAAAAKIADKYGSDKGKTGHSSTKELLKKLDFRTGGTKLTMLFVVVYIVVCLISTFFAYDRDTAIFGFRDWYMGLVAQLSFAFIYIFVAGSWRFKKPVFIMALAGSLAVFILGVLNRFRIDPLGFYSDRTDKQIFDYLSTIGQTSHYSSYICLFIPLAIVGYCFGKKLLPRLFCALVMAIGFMTTVTQNSDSAYFALAAYMVVLAFVALGERWIFSRFIEVLIICMASFKAMGYALWAYPAVAGKMDGISLFLSQSTVTWAALAVLLIIRLILHFTGKTKPAKPADVKAVKEDADTAPPDGFKLKPLRWLVLAVFIIGIAGGVTYITLNTRGALPAGYSSTNNYLYFDDGWGNHRGIEWRAAVGSFIQEPPLRKVIGAGPDCFAHMVYKYYGLELKKELDGLTLQNCHNEWLNSLINTGVIGAVAYIGIFISLFAACMKRGRKVYWLYGVAMSIAAYMVHNFFCYQSVTCTPLIFILMGMAGAIIRQMETGKNIWKSSENVL